MGKSESATSGGNWSGVRELRGAGAQPAPRPGAAAPPPAGVRTANNTFFVTWRDPREDAFRLGVPAGWQVAGGTFRAAAIDVSHVVRVESPDKTIRIFLNDPDIRPRQVPAREQFAGQYAATRLCPRERFPGDPSAGRRYSAANGPGPSSGGRRRRKEHG